MLVKITHDDQKEAIRAALDKAKQESKTEYDAVALHNIAQAYLGNAVLSGDPAVAQRLPADRVIEQAIAAPPQQAAAAPSVHPDPARRASQSRHPQDKG
jgi:hypothetical protein